MVSLPLLPFCFLLLLLLLASSSSSSFHPFAFADVLPPHPSQLGHSDPIPSQCPDNAALFEELDLTQSKLHILERSLSEKDVEFQDKLKLVASLQDEFERLKRKQASDLDALQMELASKVAKLEDNLKKTEIELQKYKDKAESLEAMGATQLSKFKQLEKLVSEQKTKLTKAEKVIHVAELTLAKAQKETAAKDNELLNVRGGWLPPWILVKLSEQQESAVVYWRSYVQPVVDATVERASQKASVVWERTKPYADNFRKHVQEKWSPVIKHSKKSITSTTAPHIQIAKSKLAEGYESAVEYVSPYLEKIHDTIKPHLQIVKEISRPYYKQVESITKPYRKKIFKLYRQFVTSARVYHVQLQKSVERTLKKVDILKPLVSKELVWFLASTLLLLPALLLNMFFSSILGSPKKKPLKVAKIHGNHAHKKAKRAKHANK